MNPGPIRDYAGTLTSFLGLFAGCPTAIGNLWDVTDRDIDRFTQSVLDEWTNSQNKSVTVLMADAIHNGRSKCRLMHLIGAAPVCYGLPTLIKPGSSSLDRSY